MYQLHKDGKHFEKFSSGICIAGRNAKRGMFFQRSSGEVDCFDNFGFYVGDRCQFPEA
jgi:hypothetical protein